MNFKIPIILASNSPRRQELLAGLGVTFEVKIASVSEEFPTRLSPQEVPEYLAKQKAEAIASIEQNTLIIAADTVVILDSTILGKPQDLVEAREFLKILSGRKHQVVTGVCIKYQDKLSLFKDITEVTFGDLTAWEINHYVEEYQPLDKAGAYGIQEWIGMVGVTRIEGSYFNVVGLPVQKLYRGTEGIRAYSAQVKSGIEEEVTKERLQPQFVSGYSEFIISILGLRSGVFYMQTILRESPGIHS